MDSFKTIGAVTFIAAACFSGQASANLLLNSGFESGSGADADSWGEFGGASGTTGRSDLSAHSGDYHAYMQFDHVNNPAAGAAYFMEQNLPAGSIDGSLNYDLSFYAKVDTTSFVGQDIFFQILWLDQDGSNGGGVQGEVLTQLIPLGIDTTYQQFGLSDLDAPDSADSVLIRFQLSAGAVADIANGLYVDDVVFSPVEVPEPASIALMAMGGLLMARRRNRG